MTLSRTEAKQLLDRLIFDETQASEWVQDVWGLSPLLGDSAAKLLEVFEALVQYLPEEELERLVNALYQDYLQGQRD